MLGRELTKLHQEFARGTAVTLATVVSSTRGEFTVVVGPARKVVKNSEAPVSDDDISHEFWLITNIGAASRRAAVNEVAGKLGCSAKEVYAAVERVRKLVK